MKTKRILVVALLVPVVVALVLLLATMGFDIVSGESNSNHSKSDEREDVPFQVTVDE